MYVWHTQTTKTKAPLIKVAEDVLERSKSNLLALLKSLNELGISHFSSSGGKRHSISKIIYDTQFFVCFVSGVKATVSKDGKAKSLSIWAH